jgi:hypothetical protein
LRDRETLALRVRVVTRELGKSADAFVSRALPYSLVLLTTTDPFAHLDSAQQATWLSWVREMKQDARDTRCG